MGDVDSIAEPDFEQETGDYMECVASFFYRFAFTFVKNRNKKEYFSALSKKVEDILRLYLILLLTL